MLTVLAAFIKKYKKDPKVSDHIADVDYDVVEKAVKEMSGVIKKYCSMSIVRNLYFGRVLGDIRCQWVLATETLQKKPSELLHLNVFQTCREVFCFESYYFCKCIYLWKAVFFTKIMGTSVYNKTWVFYVKQRSANIN